MTRTITFSEVKKHNNNESCWIVIHNDVYDVTSYLAEHPGGEQILIEAAGQDSSQEFEDVGHSDDAREIMKKYKIGSLPPGETTTAQPETISDTSHRLVFEGTSITVYSCEHIPRIDKPEKTWRTYDGSSASQPRPDLKSVCKTPSEPKIERRVQSIIVPKERRPKPSIWARFKWVFLALAGAVIVGVVLKKYAAT